MNRRSIGKKGTTRIAVPYYGQLVRPGVGVEKIFFVVDVKPYLPEPRHIALRVWNPDEIPTLPVWLRKKGISGIICSDVTLRCKYDFGAEGIWVVGGQKGEVAEIIRRWVADPSQDPLYLAAPRRVSADNGGGSFCQVARPATIGI